MSNGPIPISSRTNTSRSAAEQVLDSTRLKLGIVFNKEALFVNNDLSLVTKAINKLKTIPTKNQNPSKSLKSFSEFGLSDSLNLGLNDEEDSNFSGFVFSSPTMPKRKLTSPTLSNLELLKKRESLTERLLSNLSRNFDKNRSKALDFYETRKKILNMAQTKRRTDAVSIFHFKNFSHLRVNPDYKFNIPKLCLHNDREKCKKKLQELSFEVFLDILLKKGSYLGETKEKLFELYGIPEILQRIKVFVYDEVTAIPYIIISSKKKFQGPKKVNLRLDRKQIIVVIHDFFHNFLEYISIYQALANHFLDKTFILFNYPGQAFTMYNKDSVFNNVELSKLVDSLLFYLSQQRTISLDYDDLKFVGLGYGGLILSYFLSCNDEALKINSALLINGFAYLDEMIYTALLKCIKVFEECPADMPELAFDYYSRLTCTSQPYERQKLQERFLFNPISINARNYILKGCFESVNCSEKIQKIKIPLNIIHSLQNCLIRIGQADIWNRFNEDNNSSGISFSLKMRTSKYIEGGHDVLEENINNYENLMLDFMSQYSH